jgi:hypothetical protein
MDTNTPNTHAHGHAGDTAGYVNPEALQRGHEEDKVDAKSIMYVPLALIATFVLAYVVVTLLVNYVRSPSKEPPANPMAARQNDRPLNERFERIDSSNPNAQNKQPRLEGLQRVKGDDSPYWHSMNPTAEGNSRWFHPEDMRLNSEYSKELGLQSYAWVDDHHTAVRVPVAEALKIALTLKDPKNPAAAFLAIAEKPIPRGDLKDPSKPSNAHFGAVVEVKKEKDHDHDPKGKEHKE